jgi:hypothetical protein
MMEVFYNSTQMVPAIKRAITGKKHRIQKGLVINSENGKGSTLNCGL